MCFPWGRDWNYKCYLDDFHAAEGEIQINSVSKVNLIKMIVLGSVSWHMYMIITADLKATGYSKWNVSEQFCLTTRFA